MKNKYIYKKKHVTIWWLACILVSCKSWVRNSASAKRRGDILGLNMFLIPNNYPILYLLPNKILFYDESPIKKQFCF